MSHQMMYSQTAKDCAAHARYVVEEEIKALRKTGNMPAADALFCFLSEATDGDLFRLWKALHNT